MWLILLAVVLTITYYLVKRHYSYWERLGIPGPKPLPLVGNIGNHLIGKAQVGEVFAQIYKDYDGYPFVGIYKIGAPTILLRDPELIKAVLVKDFKYFKDNEAFVDRNTDPLLARNPFVLKGDEWKQTRSQLTPSFTSGKMKSVFSLVNNTGKEMVEYLSSLDDQNGHNVKDLCTKFACDNVALCAFGMEGNSFKDENAEFRQLAEKYVSPSSFQGFLFLLSAILPIVAKLVPIKITPKFVEERLEYIVKSSLKYRRENNVERKDFLESLNQLNLASDTFTDLDVVAHAAGFIVDGVETSATAMSFVLFELARNTKCQMKVRNEINSILEKCDGDLTYELFQETPYLDACINETLRIHSPLPFFNKSCTETYTLSGTTSDSKSQSVKVEPGTSIIIPLLGLQMDPKFFPNPETFFPERFLDKENINKYSYMPFGDGPRVCIGQRFGLLQVKMGIIHLIKNFEVTVNEKTQLPIKYLPFHILLFPKGGFWVNFNKI